MSPKEETVEELAKLIRHKMVDMNLKHKDLAKRMGKSRQWVSLLLNPVQVTNRQKQALEMLENWDAEE